MKNFYEILDVAPDANFEAIKKAFRKLASAYHPDKYPENTRFAEDMMKQINAAYSVLSDIDRRAQYDAWLKMEGEEDAAEIRQQRGAEQQSKKSESQYKKQQHSERNGSGEQSNNVPPKTTSKPFEIEFELVKKYWYVIAIVIALIVIGSNRTPSKVGNDQPTQAVRAMTYQVAELNNQVGDFKIKLELPGYKVSLRKDKDLNYYQLRVNGKTDPDVAFSYVTKAYEVTKNSQLAGYILETACGGNGCGPAYMMIDVENKLITHVPIDRGVFYADGSGISVRGTQGTNNLGDPVQVNLSYLVTEWNPNKPVGNWVDQSISASYRDLIGKHPADFFSDVTLRNSMVSLVGEDRFRTIRDRTEVAGAIEVVNGDLLVLSGCKPHACDTDSAITVVNAKTGATYSLYQVNQVFYTVGNPIVDQAINVDGFAWSAYEMVFNNYMKARGYASRVRVTGGGQLEFTN